ncbi:MAG: TlpA family protein disulfide reductase [Acidobacteriia bacterium]|nr:TlpA family protein disulfide reductase [Terriglobia bacterium]
MPALTPGKTAPDFSLEGIDGKNHSIHEELKSRLVLAAFYKKSCPVCQLTFPFLERIGKAYAGLSFEVLGIAQDEPHEAEQFAEEFQLSFPIVIDEEPYKVSSAYGITNVPSIFLIDHDGKILQTLVGFDKAGLIETSKFIATRLHQPTTPVFTKADNVPDFKPG